MRLKSLNGKCLGDLNKVKKILGFLRDNKADMAFISESHLTEEKAETVRNCFPSLGIIMNAPFHNKVGATWFFLDVKRAPLSLISVINRDSNGRRLGLKCRMENATKPTSIRGIYVPNQETPKEASLFCINSRHIAGPEASGHSPRRLELYRGL